MLIFFLHFGDIFFLFGFRNYQNFNKARGRCNVYGLRSSESKSVTLSMWYLFRFSLAQWLADLLVLICGTDVITTPLVASQIS